MSGFLEIEAVWLPQQCIKDAYIHLQEVGRDGFEGVALWAGMRKGTRFEVQATIIPKQTSYALEEGLLYAVDGDELDRINRWLYENKMVLFAQIHSHPGKAYHSETDDAFPIVATLGGISIVVPDFARHPIHLLSWAVYRLLPQKGWSQLTLSQINTFFKTD